MAYLEKLNKWAAAIAFAEAGEFDTARKIAEIEAPPVRARNTILQTLENMAVAAAFAEEGLHKEAAELMNPTVWEPAPSKPSFIELVGLQHAPVSVYVMAA